MQRGSGEIHGAPGGRALLRAQEITTSCGVVFDILGIQGSSAAAIHGTPLVLHPKP